MNKKWLILLIVVILLVIVGFLGIDELIDDNIKLFVDIEKEYGHLLLFITIPLSIIQGVVTFFPIITIITFHILVFGVTEGVIYSFIGSFLGSILSFVLGRYFFFDLSEKLWEKKKVKYQNLERYFQQYGMWSLILLRTIPLMPSNMISLMAALSPIPFRAYLWSSVFGNISMVWLFGILGMSLKINDFNFMVIVYIVYLVTLFIIFLLQLYYQRRYKPTTEQKVNE